MNNITEMTTENDDQLKLRVVKTNPNVHTHQILLFLRFRKHCGRGDRKIIKEPVDHRSHCEFISPSNIRSYALEVSPKQLPKYELNKKGTCPKNYRQ